MRLDKRIVLNTLNGLSMGIIIALIPSALLNELVKVLMPSYPQLSVVLTMTNLAMVTLPAVSALCVGMLGKFSPIQTGALVLASVMGAGNFKMVGDHFVAAGTGDVINIALTIMVGYVLIAVLGQKLKAYTILLVPAIVMLVAGGIGMMTLKPVASFTKILGIGINQLTELQPLLMGTLLGIVFALLIVSPVSSVGIATAIGLTGVAAGAANLGIVAAAFSLAIYGWKANTVGTSLAHFLGSPKMQMANLMANPKLLLPVMINAGIMGFLASLFGITGTPSSAGFGFAGLIGPIAAVNGMEEVTVVGLLLIVTLFVIVPVILGLVSNALFNRQMSYFQAKDFELDYR
ncbi:PTS sugar transporter subunit IIC [Lentilactobacillus sp. Marseille-Q4993]|uniref:PTS transporter subunit IIC n=1 Tax=Lentilactobacillus sp. Marseille-Q4993 TaxID=3039492 RepID=UPI0024BCFB74|nr:PTS sugar transporter subunit IIC [Lentilactobacillus sp. Marseille-Q4993]